MDDLLTELDRDIDELVAIYPELTGLAPGYVPTADDHWSVRMLHAMRTELAELEDLAECELCERLADDLYTRTDDRDGAEVRVCGRCAALDHVRCDDHIDS